MTDFPTRVLELIEENTSVVESTGCLEWTGTRNNGGYGFKEIFGHGWLMHRAHWTAVKGDIPAGKLCLHHCDNPSCVNPAHLYIGTHADNTRDAILRGRHLGRVPEWGVKKSRVRKLTDEQVRGIRGAVGTQSQIAREFGCSRSYVSEIRSGKRKGLVK